MPSDINNIKKVLSATTCSRRFDTVGQTSANASSNGDEYFEIKDINEVITLLDISTSDVKSSDWQDV